MRLALTPNDSISYVASLETAQTKIYTYMFQGHHLALIYGINIAVQRLVNGRSCLLSPP